MGVNEENWKGERDLLSSSLDDGTRDLIIDMLDYAAAAARANQLREAARRLENARCVLIEHRTFYNWDNGIWCFASVIKLIRGMSAETVMPREYQRFLDAIPSARYDQDMTLSQLAFWYGESDIRVRQANEKRNELKSALIFALLVIAALFYFYYGG